MTGGYAQAEGRIHEALDTARRYGQIPGDHHRAWVIDQMVRALLGCRRTPQLDYASCPAYESFVKLAKAGEDGPETYDWYEGIAP